jgi:hypothetical protein
MTTTHDDNATTWRDLAEQVTLDGLTWFETFEAQALADPAEVAAHLLEEARERQRRTSETMPSSDTCPNLRAPASCGTGKTTGRATGRGASTARGAESGSIKPAFSPIALTSISTACSTRTGRSCGPSRSTPRIPRSPPSRPAVSRPRSPRQPTNWTAREPIGLVPRLTTVRSAPGSLGAGRTLSVMGNRHDDHGGRSHQRCRWDSR